MTTIAVGRRVLRVHYLFHHVGVSLDVVDEAATVMDELEGDLDRPARERIDAMACELGADWVAVWLHEQRDERGDVWEALGCWNHQPGDPTDVQWEWSR